jgi:hypothetical protein
MGCVLTAPRWRGRRLARQPERLEVDGDRSPIAPMRTAPSTIQLNDFSYFFAPSPTNVVIPVKRTRASDDRLSRRAENRRRAPGSTSRRQASAPSGRFSTRDRAVLRPTQVPNIRLENRWRPLGPTPLGAARRKEWLPLAPVAPTRSYGACGVGGSILKLRSCG